MCVCVFKSLCVSIYICVYVNVNVYACVYIYMYLNVRVYWKSMRGGRGGCVRVCAYVNVFLSIFLI